MHTVKIISNQTDFWWNNNEIEWFRSLYLHFSYSRGKRNLYIVNLYSNGKILMYKFFHLSFLHVSSAFFNMQIKSNKVQLKSILAQAIAETILRWLLLTTAMEVVGIGWKKVAVIQYWALHCPRSTSRRNQHPHVRHIIIIQAEKLGWLNNLLLLIIIAC